MKAARGALQIFIAILGSVMVIAGLGTVLLGAASIVGAEDVSGTVDSEMRFYAVWYAGAGLLLLRSVPRVESERRIVGAVAALFSIAGCSRGLSWLLVGRPHNLAATLMVIELALPFVMLPWHAAVARRSALRTSSDF